MDVVAAVMDTRGLLGLIAGIVLLIVLGNLILGGNEDGERRLRRRIAGVTGETEGAWHDGEDLDDEDEQMDVLVATRALIVPDPYGGRHLYVELDDGDVVHLSGRWLDDYHVGERGAPFPCTRFRPYADFPDDPFDLEHPYRVECLGEPIEPLVAAEPLPDEARRVGLAPADWERLPTGFDRLLALVGPARVDEGVAVAPEHIAALEEAFRAAPAPDPAPRPAARPKSAPGRDRPIPPAAGVDAPASPAAGLDGSASPAIEGPMSSTSSELEPLDDLDARDAGSDEVPPAGASG